MSEANSGEAKKQQRGKRLLFLLFAMCYDHHVFVVLEQIRGCYELWGSWVLDLNPHSSI